MWGRVRCFHVVSWRKKLTTNSYNTSVCVCEQTRNGTGWEVSRWNVAKHHPKEISLNNCEVWVRFSKWLGTAILPMKTSGQQDKGHVEKNSLPFLQSKISLSRCLRSPLVRRKCTPHIVFEVKWLQVNRKTHQCQVGKSCFIAHSTPSTATTSRDHHWWNTHPYNTPKQKTVLHRAAGCLRCQIDDSGRLLKLFHT